MSTHTPGPWVLEFSEESGLAHILGPRSDGNVCPADGRGLLFYVDCATLADMNVGIFPDIEPEAKANAVLAACAPELLLALAPFVAFFEHALRGHTPDYEHRSAPDKVVCGWNGAQLTMRDFRNARAALAKAENA